MRLWGIVLFLACTGEEKPVQTETVDVLQDQDGDGFNEAEDCNDNDPDVFPTADEQCDGVDNNCDGFIDESVQVFFYADADGDRFGNPDVSVEGCAAPDGFVEDNTDCDDLRADVFAGADEVCDGLDNNCDGEADEGLFESYFADVDEDGFGDSNTVISACALESGLSLIDGDCDDNDSLISPAGLEMCDGIDNNCDGDVDEGVQVAFYTDADEDGFGDDASVEYGCAIPTDKVDVGGDCDDIQFYAHPLMIELCDGLDNNCDGSIDESGAYGETTWYLDSDVDGYGVTGTTQVSCVEPQGYSSNDLDCDDSNGLVSPDAQEDCATLYDDNCNGVSNESGAIGETTWYLDADGDTYGTPNVYLIECAAPTGFVSNSDDCNDLSDQATPVGVEVCDGLDNDCDGTIDNSGSIGEVVWYVDADVDGYGVDTTTMTQCDQPVGYTNNIDDCDDTDIDVNPGADETCLTPYDDDCDGVSNELGAVDESIWYFDEDGDGFGLSSVSVIQCDAPTDYVILDGDCDDVDGSISPVAIEVCDAIDNDCDGDIDFDDSDITVECYDGINCLDILQNDPAASDGYYTVDPQGTGLGVEVYCNMTENGGGWTLAASISTSNQNHALTTAFDADGDGVVTYATIGEKYDDAFIDALWTDRVWVQINGGSGDIHCQRSNQVSADGWAADGEFVCGYSFSSTTNFNQSCAGCGPMVWLNYDYRSYRNPYSGCNGAAATYVPSGHGGCGYHPSRAGYLWIR